MGAAHRYLAENTYWWEPYWFGALIVGAILWGILLFATDPDFQDVCREMKRKR